MHRVSEAITARKKTSEQFRVVLVVVVAVVILQIESRASYTVDKYYITELYPPPNTQNSQANACHF